MGLLIDVSGSVDSRFDFEQSAATSFLQHTLRAGFDKAFIVGFNSHSQMAQDFTDNVQLLSQAFTACTMAAELRFTTRFIVPAKKSF